MVGGSKSPLVDNGCSRAVFFKYIAAVYEIAVRDI